MKPHLMYFSALLSFGCASSSSAPKQEEARTDQTAVDEESAADDTEPSEDEAQGEDEDEVPAPRAATYKVERVVEDGDDYDYFTDCLTVSLVEDNSLEFDFHLSFAYGHVCSMTGTAEPVFADEWAYRDDDGCHLILRQTRDGWSLIDHGAMCRENNCGMRGYIEGAMFPFTFDEPLPVERCSVIY